MFSTPSSLQTLAVWAVVAAASGLAAILAWQWSGASANWIAHTLIVQQQFSRTLSAVQDMETGQRGYLLTGQEQYLEPYAKAKADLPGIITALKNLVRDNAEQLGQVAEIEHVLQRRLEPIESSITLMRSGEAEKARDVVTSGYGKEMMDKLRALVAAAQAKEQVLFETRQASFQSQRTWLLGALLATLLGCSGLAFFAFVRERERAGMLEEAAEILKNSNVLLEERVTARTEELAFERDRAEAERERAEALLRDVTHRIGNTLALVVGFINLHIRHSRDPLAVKTLTAARSRIHAIASAQRRINVTNDLDLVRIDDLIESVLDDLIEANSEELVTIDVAIQPLLAPAQSATSLCVLTQEFVMNSLKHAFPGGRKGEIKVMLKKAEGGGAVLIVSDNGIGIPPDHLAVDDGEQEGLGNKIATLLSRQFNGSITYSETKPGDASPGAKVVVTLPDLTLSTPSAEASAA